LNSTVMQVEINVIIYHFIQIFLRAENFFFF
jgi:hypothetical protein